MAYLEPETLTCKACRRVGDIVWVIGVGPHTKSDGVPAYVAVETAGPWVIKEHGTATQVLCPNCNELILERTR